jgi:hypothetical protein
VTVVATGYGDEGRRKSASRFKEPAEGEVRVQRRSQPAEPRRGRSLDDLEIPEFIPNL